MPDEIEPQAEAEETTPAAGAGSEETARLKEQLAEKEQQIIDISRRLDEATGLVGSRNEEIAALRRAVAEGDEKLAAAGRSLETALAGYRRTLAEANPEIIGDMINGDSLESIDESLARAKDLVSRVREGIESRISRSRVPAGAPERTAPDLSGLTPREKIQYAVGNNKY